MSVRQIFSDRAKALSLQSPLRGQKPSSAPFSFAVSALTENNLLQVPNLREVHIMVHSFCCKGRIYSTRFRKDRFPAGLRGIKSLSSSRWKDWAT